MTRDLRNPVLSGFHPDPSITRGADAYYLVTSSFEYLPGLPVYRSTDLEHWEAIGHVAVRDAQVGVSAAPTPGGVWAPTIRFHDGRYYVIVSVFLGGRGCVLFTADDPAGPWSAGIEIPAVDGIDPDLAWDDEGTAYVTFAVFPHGIRQVRVDLETGQALDAVRPLWAGSGRLAPEGPHLFSRGDWWYLVVAEGGTDRGHAVTVARSRRPDGPFESAPHNPILTAAGTGSRIQNLGHADLVEEPDGGTRMVLLGVRPVGFAASFSPLGRETFQTRVEWVDGWPRVAFPELADTTDERWSCEFASDADLDDAAWIAVRRTPRELGVVTPRGLVLRADGSSFEEPRPCFLGRRQSHLIADFSAVLDVAGGTGGIALRCAEDHWIVLEAGLVDGAVRVTATAVAAGLRQSWEARLPAGEVTLTIACAPPRRTPGPGASGGDRIRLLAGPAMAQEAPVELAELDGRHWSFETVRAFTGRALGVTATSGEVTVRRVDYVGRAVGAD